MTKGAVHTDHDLQRQNHRKTLLFSKVLAISGNIGDDVGIFFSCVIRFLKAMANYTLPAASSTSSQEYCNLQPLKSLSLWPQVSKRKFKLLGCTRMLKPRKCPPIFRFFECCQINIGLITLKESLSDLRQPCPL